MMEYYGLRVGDRVRLSSMGGGKGTITAILDNGGNHPFQVSRDNYSSPLSFWREELTKIEPEEPKEPTPQDWADKWKTQRRLIDEAKAAMELARAALVNLDYTLHNGKWSKLTTTREFLK